MLVNIKLRSFLQQKFGINLHLIYKLLSLNGINSSSSLIDKVWFLLSDTELSVLYVNIVKFFKVESVLQSQIFANIRNLKLLRGYKGFRHYYSLPVSGQRTKTNAKTSKRSKKIIKLQSSFHLKKVVQKKNVVKSKNKKNKNVIKVKKK